MNISLSPGRIKLIVMYKTMDYLIERKKMYTITEKRQINRKLDSVHVFWKNDKPGGVGLIIPSTGGIILNAVIDKLVSNMEIEYASSPNKEAYVKGLEELLYMYGKLPEMNKSQFAWMVFGSVYMLMQLGKLVNDEFNGIVYYYA